MHNFVNMLKSSESHTFKGEFMVLNYTSMLFFFQSWGWNPGSQLHTELHHSPFLFRGRMPGCHQLDVHLPQPRAVVCAIIDDQTCLYCTKTRLQIT